MNKNWSLIFFAYGAFLALILFHAYHGTLPRFVNLPMYDKIGHFYLLGMLAYLAHRATKRFTLNVFGLPLPPAALAVTLLVILEEFLQALSPYRTFSLLDLWFGFAGIFFFLWLDHKTTQQEAQKITKYT